MTTATAVTSERLGWVDWGRLMSIGFVVTMHSCLGGSHLFQQIGSPSWSVALAYFILASICVPVFVMISGVTTLWSPCARGQVITPRKTWQRIQPLLLPVLFWSAAYNIGINGHYTLQDALHTLWAPTGLVHLWFIYMLVGLYLLSPLVQAIATSRPELLHYLLLLWVVFGLFSHVVIPWFNADPSRTFGIFHGDVINFLGYYVAGYVLMQRPPLKKSIAGLCLAGGFLISYAITFIDNVYLMPAPHGFNFPHLNFVSPGIALEAIGAFSLLRHISWHPRWLTPVSALVIGVYFIHEMILQYMRIHLNWVGYPYAAWWFIPAQTISVLLLALAMAWALARLQGKRRIFF